MTYPSKIKGGNCSRECANILMSKKMAGSNGANWQGGNDHTNCFECGKSMAHQKGHKQRKYCNQICMGKWFSKNLIKEKSPRWNGGVHINQGYRMIKVENHPSADFNGYVREHRIVMEKHLGRFLKRKEHVHHINHDRTDNRLENLQLISNKEHGVLHLTKKRARKMAYMGHKVRWGYKRHKSSS